MKKDNAILSRANALRLKIEDAKKRMGEAEGGRKQLLQTLRTEFKVQTVREARSLLERLTAREEELRTTIERRLSKIETALEDGPADENSF